MKYMVQNVTGKSEGGSDSFGVMKNILTFLLMLKNTQKTSTFNHSSLKLIFPSLIFSRHFQREGILVELRIAIRRQDFQMQYHETDIIFSLQYL